MVINALFPVLALMFIGGLVKRFRVLDDAFFTNSDKLVYFVLFPVMLFWKIGAAPIGGDVNYGYLVACLAAVASVFLLSLLFIRFASVERFKAGSFNQSCYRFNTYIGMAVVINLFGERGIQLFSILVGLLIPCINIMSVSALVWYGGKDESVGERLVSAVKNMLVNPLILACLAGLVYAAVIGGFPAYIDNTLRLLSSTTLPLALLSIGGAITFQGVRDNALLAVAGTLMKLVVLPLIGLLFLTIFNVEGPAWKVSMLFFTLPTSTAIYVLSSQLNSDTETASAAIGLSTCCAFISMSVIISVFSH